MSRSWMIGGVAAMALAVAACGTERTERTTGGAAAGAATGAGVGALGGPVGALAGAGIGAGAGAVAGSQTNPSQINLGRPPWSNPEVRTPLDEGSGATRASASRGSGASSASVREAQQALSQRGFDPGPADGAMGPRTRDAISAFQRQNNLPVTGRVDARTAEALNIQGSAPVSRGASSGRPRDERDRAYMGGGMVGGGSGTGAGSNLGEPSGTMGGGSGGTTAPR
jgi:hypothetical protein